MRVRWAVAEVVKKQAEAGIDVINDGEMSKPSYATYVKDRLAGFGGTGNTFVYQDLADFPKLQQKVFGDPGRSRRKTPACNAPISVRDQQAAETDVDNLKAALGAVKAAGGFMSAASPGVISVFFRNDHYPSEEAYLYAIAEAMRRRVRGGRQGRLRAADRLPRSRDGQAHQVLQRRPRRRSARPRRSTSRR